jgi:lysophospholipase L1-like esterase/acyl CoA:acetate/3-ketoacid CoA transferase alpha subunit
MAFKRYLRAPAGVLSTLQLADGTTIQPDGSGFARVPGNLVDDLLANGYTLPEAMPSLTTVTNRAGMQYLGQSSGGSQTVTYRTRYVTLKGCRSSGLRLVFSNTELTASGEFDAPVNITLRVSVEIGGVFYKVFFGGKRDVTIEPGAFVMSDPVGVSLAPSSEMFVRTRISVGTLGEKWAVGTSLDTAMGESYIASDVVDGGAIGANAASSYGPVAILGMVNGPQPSVAVPGSSSAAGQGDTLSGTERDLGYLSRFLSNNTGYHRQVRATQTAAMFLADSRRRLALLAAISPTHVIFQLGTNDIGNGGSFESVQSTLLQCWNILAGMGIRVVATTFSPHNTSSTDNWATPGNQTPASNNAVRGRINDWIRSLPAPLTGYLECADVVETSRGSGVWKSDGTANKYTTDGLHLSPFAHALVAEALAPELAQFTL